jgi:hypothetical protein
MTNKYLEKSKEFSCFHASRVVVPDPDPQGSILV